MSTRRLLFALAPFGLAAILSQSCVTPAVASDNPESGRAGTWMGGRAWWQSLSRHEQIIVVEAETQGLFDGYLDAATDVSHEGLKSGDSLETAWMFKTGPDFPKTFGEYANEVTEWYKMHQTHDAIVSAVLACLSAKPGTFCSDLNAR